MTLSKAPMHPLLAQYLLLLSKHPLRTKAVTTGVICFLQEVLGSLIAGLPPSPTSKNASPLTKVLARLHMDAKAFKMGIYGLLVSAPVAHYLNNIVQKAFQGKHGAKYKVGQLLASNLIAAPVQTAVFLASMAVINGAASVEDIVRTVKSGFFSVIRVTWMISPTSMAIAQRFVPVELWAPFFTFVQFTLGLVFNINVKRMRVIAAKKEEEEKTRKRAEAAAAKAE
ncbi:hypothetical protein JVU11DRAFT_5038 [Chiua virens]|nr:hypothetical protein JVU11DRAFT_5038 [Chiua virens]